MHGKFPWTTWGRGLDDPDQPATGRYAGKDCILAYRPLWFAGSCHESSGPNSVATEAHGSFWLLTVEMMAEDCRAGGHVARIGPLMLPPVDRYFMRVLSSHLKPGSTTPIHTIFRSGGILSCRWWTMFRDVRRQPTFRGWAVLYRSG